MPFEQVPENYLAIIDRLLENQRRFFNNPPQYPIHDRLIKIRKMLDHTTIKQDKDTDTLINERIAEWKDMYRKHRNMTNPDSHIYDDELLDFLAEFCIMTKLVI